MVDEHGLTPKRTAFIQEYLVDLNATQAAIRAGYSAKSADSIGRKLLKDTAVSSAVAEVMARRAEKTARTALNVLEDIQAVTRKAWTAGDLKTTLKGLEMEGKHLGMFSDKTNNIVEGQLIIKWES